MRREREEVSTHTIQLSFKVEMQSYVHYKMQQMVLIKVVRCYMKIMLCTLKSVAKCITMRVVSRALSESQRCSGSQPDNCHH